VDVAAVPGPVAAATAADCTWQWFWMICWRTEWTGAVVAAFIKAARRFDDSESETERRLHKDNANPLETRAIPGLSWIRRGSVLAGPPGRKCLVPDGSAEISSKGFPRTTHPRITRIAVGEGRDIAGNWLANWNAHVIQLCRNDYAQRSLPAAIIFSSNFPWGFLSH